MDDMAGGVLMQTVQQKVAGGVALAFDSARQLRRNTGRFWRTGVKLSAFAKVKQIELF